MEQVRKLFEVKAKSTQITPDGERRTLSQIFIVDSHSVTEAEARTIKELEGNSDINVLAAKATNYVGILETGGEDYFFKAKLSYAQLGLTGKEKPVSYETLIRANSISDALASLKESVADAIAQHRVLSIAETNIVGVIQSEENAV